jgi:hypothetical protein
MLILFLKNLIKLKNIWFLGIRDVHYFRSIHSSWRKDNNTGKKNTGAGSRDQLGTGQNRSRTVGESSLGSEQGRPDLLTSWPLFHSARRPPSQNPMAHLPASPAAAVPTGHRVSPSLRSCPSLPQLKTTVLSSIGAAAGPPSRSWRRGVAAVATAATGSDKAGECLLRIVLQQWL